MTVTFAIIQSNFTVGLISGNIGKISALYDIATVAGADLVILSEMAITGYPLEDLALRKGFQEAAMNAANQLALLTRNGPALLVGGIWAEEGAVYNTLFLMEGGKIIHRQYKYQLPNYGIFDEKRLFAAGKMPEPVLWHGINIGLLVCEDMWSPAVATHLKENGADILICVNASPYETDKNRTRITAAMERVRETGLPLVYVNQVGGQDELVFDGQSFVLSCEGETTAQLCSFAEDIELVKWHKDSGWIPGNGRIEPVFDETEAIYRAMATGLSDFVSKNGFSGVMLGLSGGIDSALTAALAVDALGSQRVRAVMIPSPYTSQESIEDASECAAMLGIQLDTIPIEPAMQAFHAMLGNSIKHKNIMEEDLQPRLRGATLMALSSEEGRLLLSTGNKSELSVGYTTLYGDMCGGYNVLKDIYKTTVYKIAKWRNLQQKIIPERIITRLPSAELRPNQADCDTLPPYDLLDAILLRLIERQLSVTEIVAQGYKLEVVETIAHMLYSAEYKRRQSPPGVKITGMSLGRDRRYPISNGWRL